MNKAAIPVKAPVENALRNHELLFIYKVKMRGDG